MHFPVFFSPMDANPHGEMNTSQAKGGRITLSPVRVVRSNSNVMATPRNEKKKSKIRRGKSPVDACAFITRFVYHLSG